MRVKKLHPDAKLPTRSDDGSNGYDLYASEEVVIGAKMTAIVPTGISIELDIVKSPYVLPVFKIEDRSSMAIKGLRTGAGVVDYSYRGEIKVVMHNLNDLLYKINKGDKIAQGLVYCTSTQEVEEVEELNNTQRGAGGFGSTGK